ncbi:hypothetical protein J6590_014464 [Homalodisca vitripennis]|nr:hypothetical protein J6590_014464 [Homalodisca vitripennis]
MYCKQTRTVVGEREKEVSVDRAAGDTTYRLHRVLYANRRVDYLFFLRWPDVLVTLYWPLDTALTLGGSAGTPLS